MMAFPPWLTHAARNGVALALLASIAACAEDPKTYRIGSNDYRIGTDVPCLEHEVSDFHKAFYRAVVVCHTTKPDLTGDGKLQTEALAWNIPFTIRPNADKAIKKHFFVVPTGTLIANVAPDRYLVGGPYN